MYLEAYVPTARALGGETSTFLLIETVALRPFRPITATNLLPSREMVRDKGAPPAAASPLTESDA